MNSKNCVFCQQEINFETKSYAFPFFIYDNGRCDFCEPEVKYRMVQKRAHDPKFPMDCMDISQLNFELPNHQPNLAYKIVYHLERSKIYIYEKTQVPAYVYGSGFMSTSNIKYLEKEDKIHEVDFKSFYLTPTNAQSKLKILLNFK